MAHQDWLAAYRDLSAVSQSILQVISAYYEPIRRKLLLQLLRTAKVHSEKEELLSQNKLNQLLSDLRRDGFLEEEAGYFTSSASGVEELMRLASGEQQLARWAEAVHTHNPVRAESWQIHRYRSYGQGIREIRFALYRGDFRAVEDNLTYLHLQYPERLHVIARAIDITTRLLASIETFSQEMADEVDDWSTTTDPALTASTRAVLETIRSRHQDRSQG